MELTLLQLPLTGSDDEQLVATSCESPMTDNVVLLRQAALLSSGLGFIFSFLVPPGQTSSVVDKLPMSLPVATPYWSG